MALVLPYHTSHHDSLPIPVLALEGATSYWAVAVANLPGHKSNLGAQGTKGCDGRSRQAGSPDQLTTWPTRRPGGYRVVSDGQTSIRRAVERALPGVPHQLCQFHFLREAAQPVFEADRHAKVRLKAEVRGVRPIERARRSGSRGGPRGSASGGAPRLRPRGAQSHPRGRPPAAGRLGAAAQGPAGGGGGQPE